MSDLKFSCPHCSQHISCGPEYAGMQIKCPACQNDITIPRPAAATPSPAAAPAPGPLRVSVPSSSHAAAPPAPPPPPSRSSAPPPPRAAVSGLSVARPSAPPPPQHVASAGPPPAGGSVTTNTNPVVQWAGLIGAFLVTAIIIGMAATWKPPEPTGDLVFVREKRGRKSVLVLKERAGKPANQDAEMDEDDADASGAPSSSSTATAAPATPQWTLDLQTAQVPDAAAAGQFGGRAFAPERAYLQRTPTGAYVFTVRQGTASQADREFIITLPTKGEPLDGQSWNITAQSPNAPRVIKRWVQNARQQTKMFTNGYAMKLQFEQTANNQIPAKLFVALPDEDKTFVAGTVTASFLVAGGTPAQPRRQ